MFNIGDSVVMNGYGICTVAAIGHPELRNADPEKLYYTLSPSGEAGYVHVPVDSQSIRPVISAAEARALIASIPERKVSVNRSRDRQLRYKSTLKDGSPEDLMLMVMEIYQTELSQAKGKRAFSQDTAFREGEKRLNEELALALGVKAEEVHSIIEKSIAHSKNKR